MLKETRPYTRWWWFYSEFDEKDIDEQINWIAERGFGGVEIAWVYPESPDSTGPEFLGERWLELSLYAAEACASRNLGCDFTFGTLWPFGGSFVSEEDASKTFRGLSSQRLVKSWEMNYREEPGFILDHLSAKSLEHYSGHLIGKGFGQLASAGKASFFCDSWEVLTENLSTSGFPEKFLEVYGYNLEPYFNDLESHRDVRFDYRALLSREVLDNFYGPYSDICNRAGALSRVQCHGAPTDILAAYALADIPETETLLFDPDFSLIGASALALSGKKVLSSETFTCLYGWEPYPASPPGMAEEEIEDLKCLADSQFAWGVNQVVWHGMPFSTSKKKNRFYATVHVGWDGALSPHLKAFNSYLEVVSRWMRRGEIHSRLGVYLPLEDQWMEGELPEDLQKPSSRFFWELQECKVDDSLLPWRPVWISGTFLKEFRVEEGMLTNGHVNLPALTVDSRWLTLEHLSELIRLQRAGAQVFFTRKPSEPGRTGHSGYSDLIREINLVSDLSDALEERGVGAVLKSGISLDYWCRKEGRSYYIFIAHPGMRKLRYPMKRGYGKGLESCSLSAQFISETGSYALDLSFDRTESLLIHIDDQSGSVHKIDLPVFRN